ncbi:tetratricopeptide repeat protein [Nocardiopsis lambiniae]|uniref:Tetratricopeptide repeat protein n=1 Tax=Nocardiopsis lambiniae TaxID=3075539 RepID=A0ABU2MH92_9ACTN|nr:tetratricopeptide repeat protein [Nocardiopsis sp. DSM 44743]MDT0332072.1 tetratricopeptide repeat protein [Nocardiopsis sp. DSM 44743]
MSDAGTPPAPLRRAMGLLEANRPRQALEAVEEELGRDPGSDLSWALKGRCHLHLDENEEALAALSRALGLGNRSTGLLTMTSTALSRVGRPEEALEIANELLRAEPQVASHHLLAGRAMAEIHRAGHPALTEWSRNAALAARTARGLNGLDPWTHSMAGYVFLRIGAAHSAEEAFRTALSLDPQEDQAIRGLAVIDAHRGRMRRAGRRGEQVLALDPGQADIPRLVYTGALRLSLLANLCAGVTLLPAVLWGNVFHTGGLSATVFVLGVLVFAAPALWSAARIATLSSAMRRHLSRQPGFVGWAVGTAVSPSCVFVAALPPPPWSLTAIALFVGGLLWQRHHRNRLMAGMEARERASRP